MVSVRLTKWTAHKQAKQTHTQKERERDTSIQLTSAQWLQAIDEVKGVAVLGCLTFVCGSTKYSFAIRWHSLHEHSLMFERQSMGNCVERFTAIDVLKSDWKSRLRLLLSHINECVAAFVHTKWNTENVCRNECLVLRCGLDKSIC